MSIEFTCPHCGNLLRTADETAGKQARCPECGTVQPIPAAGAAAPPAPPLSRGPEWGASGAAEFNPYTAPSVYSSAPHAAPSPSARNQVQGPAVGLIVTGALGILAALISMVGNLINIAAPQGQVGGGPDEQMFMLFSGGVGLAFNGLGLAVAVFIIYGALKMKNLQSYSASMAASILAMIPCLSPCCLIGLPMGIWSLVVLSNVQVKSAFTQ